MALRSTRQTEKRRKAERVISSSIKRPTSSPLELWLIFTALIWGVFFLSMVHNWANRDSHDSDLEVETPTGSLLAEPISHDSF